MEQHICKEILHLFVFSLLQGYEKKKCNFKSRNYKLQLKSSANKHIMLKFLKNPTTDHLSLTSIIDNLIVLIKKNKI